MSEEVKEEKSIIPIALVFFIVMIIAWNFEIPTSFYTRENSVLSDVFNKQYKDRDFEYLEFKCKYPFDSYVEFHQGGELYLDKQFPIDSLCREYDSQDWTMIISKNPEVVNAESRYIIKTSGQEKNRMLDRKLIADIVDIVNAGFRISDESKIIKESWSKAKVDPVKIPFPDIGN